MSNYVTFVTVGDSGTIYYSQDGGGHWTLAASSLGDITSLKLLDVAYGNGLFVAVGNNGDGSQVLLTSPDGDSWNDHTPVDQGRMLYSVDYVNGRFIAGAIDLQSGEYVYESTDGINWGTAISLNTTAAAPIVGVDYCNGFYLALDSAGTMRKSVDGSTWTAVDSDSTQTYTGIASDGKRFVVLTQSGSVFATSDVETWSILPGLPASNKLYTITYEGLEWAAGFAGGSFIVSRKIVQIPQ